MADAVVRVEVHGEGQAKLGKGDQLRPEREGVDEVQVVWVIARQHQRGQSKR